MFKWEFRCLQRGCAAAGTFVAGVTWTSRTASAPWAARTGHTSVVDAAGAIYVIGGIGSTLYQDVWASTDGGARPDRGGVVLGGTHGVPMVCHTCATGHAGSRGVLEGYSQGTIVVPKVDTRGPRGLPRGPVVLLGCLRAS